MFDTIIKRDGREVPFDESKIAGAILKAFQASGSLKGTQAAQNITQSVTAKLRMERLGAPPSIEHIQDLVEQSLIESGFAPTAKAYILYRAERSRAREMNTRLMRIYEDITFKPATQSDIKRENANIDGDTPMGAMLKYGSEGAKQFNELFVLNPEHARAHREGDIHIHDMDFLTQTTTCCQIDLLKLFDGGFSTGHGVLREPQNIASYSALACIAIQSNQNDQHGGQSIVNFDYGMAPGVIKTYKKRYRENILRAGELLTDVIIPEDALKTLSKEHTLRMELPNDAPYFLAEQKLLKGLSIADEIIAKIQSFARIHALKETDHATYKAMVAFIHNLNTMNSRAGAQTPFSSINYGMDTTAEGRMVVKNVLLSTEAGLGNGETSIFPIQIFRVKEGISYNPGDLNYDLFLLAMRVSAKRLFPNFAFQDAPFNIQYYDPARTETQIAYMGCRTRVIGNINDPSREICNGRGNLSFTSINLPRLAIRANSYIPQFFTDLDDTMDLIFNQLKERFEIQAGKTMRNYPFLMGQGVWIDSENLKTDEPLREVLKHGSLSVGFIGLAETLTALMGTHHGRSPEAQELGLKIIAHMRKRCDEQAQKTQMNYTLLATPAEGLSGRFVKIDRAKFGKIDGVTDRDYYTNSFHVPVYHPIGALNKIKIEAPYHALTNAGHITYVELDGDPAKNIKAFEKIVRCMKDAGVGYGSINHPVDRDPVCGYSGIIGDTCPLCGREEGDVPFDRIRRITGYLVGTLDRFNNGKRAEERERVKHNAPGLT